MASLCIAVFVDDSDVLCLHRHNSSTSAVCARHYPEVKGSCLGGNWKNKLPFGKGRGLNNLKRDGKIKCCFR